MKYEPPPPNLQRAHGPGQPLPGVKHRSAFFLPSVKIQLCHLVESEASGGPSQMGNVITFWASLAWPLKQPHVVFAGETGALMWVFWAMPVTDTGIFL